MARLGDVCEKVTDYVASGSFAALKENVLITNEENYAVMVKTADFANGFTKNLTYTDKRGYDFLRNSNLFGGELILSNIGSIGKVFKVPYLNRPMTLASNTVMIKTETAELTDYLYYYFLSPAGYKSLLSISSGTSMLKFNKTELKKLEVPIPSQEEQIHIIAVLDKVSELITLRKEQLAKLDQLVKSRFIELFGDPVKNNMGWQSKALNEVCDGIGDGLHGTPVYDDNGEYPFINGNNLIDGKIVITPATKMVAVETYKKHFIDISTNAILISINGTLGKIAFYNGEKVMLGKSACYCNLKQDINKVFVYGVMKSDAFAEFLENSSTKSTIKNVGLKAMREFKLISPPTELQERFATFVAQTDKSKLAIQQSLDKLELLKKSLMQEYFG